MSAVVYIFTVLKKRYFYLKLIILSIILQVVTATLDVHKFTVANLLPTPDHAHYLFSLKEFSRLKSCC